ncbi:hypothetical protein RHSIM_Rhsim07G0228600 [Rhododendron simsii]|uniref:Uncharacterized protein n=1 Tax=Rhododendron simsii TaxID=118357 RepID=A0A834LJ74_RHOSS|nr:hypothetical protein RHSIM_Rhsim07G0228600 [Rhododendron simsii]
MDFPKPSLRSPNPILSLSSFIHQHCHRLGAELTNRLAATWPPRQKHVGLLSSSSSPPTSSSLPSSPFASVSQQEAAPRHVFDVALSSDVVSKTLAGTSVYTVSNSDNEFVLVKLRRGELQSRARVVPITLEQLKASNAKSGFDGVPVFQNEIILKALPNINKDACRPAAATKRFSAFVCFVLVFLYSELLPFVYGNYFLCLQSDLLVVKKRNRRYCPIYFRKEDIEKELSTVSRASRGSGVSKHIMVGSLEDVLKKMEMNKTNSGWEDLIFIPPGKSHSQHIQEVVNT